MKVAVVGSRNFNDIDLIVDTLGQYKIGEIISGGAAGADSLAEDFADAAGIKKTIFKANWEKYGRSAGYIRNIDIISNCDICIAFWDGKSRGTKHSISLCKKHNKKCVIIKF